MKNLNLNKIMLGNVFSGYINGLLVMGYWEILSDNIIEYIDFKLDKFDEIDNIDKLFEEMGDMLFVMGGDYDDYLKEFKLCMDNLEYEFNGEDVFLENDVKELLINKFKNKFYCFLECEV